MSIFDFIFWCIIFSPGVFLVVVVIAAFICISNVKRGDNIYVKKEEEKE